MSIPKEKLNGKLNREAVSYDEFVRGNGQASSSRPGPHGESASFSFRDDKWCLLDVLKPSERKGCATVNFSGLPAWLLFDAKAYIAHLWLETVTYANDLQQAMTSLRWLGRTFPNFKVAPIDLGKKHAHQFRRQFLKHDYSDYYNKAVFGYVNDFMSFVRQQHPGGNSNDFVVELPSRRVEDDYQPGPPSEKKIPTEILALVLDACEADLQAYYEAKRNYTLPENSSSKEYQKAVQQSYRMRRKEGHPIRPSSEQTPKLRELYGRAVKSQVVKLSICVGRRASAVCHSSANITTKELEWLNEAGVVEKAVLVRFRETKIRNIDENVVCPGAFGEMALNAIKTARELTADLRRDNPQWAGFLFLVPGLEFRSAQVISPGQINQYLSGVNNKKRKKRGLLQRYNIGRKKITTHNFRLNRATNLWLGGMQLHEVADDLGHRGTEMVVRHYVVGAEESRRRYQLFMDHQALSGAIVDFAGGQEIVCTRLSGRHVEIMKQFGLVVVPTRYGYCARHASLGPCDRTTPCYTGPDGETCDFHISSPDALPALREDKEVVEANIALYKDSPGYSFWIQNNRNQLAVINNKIEQAVSLGRRLACGDSCGKCCGRVG